MKRRSRFEREKYPYIGTARTKTDAESEVKKWRNKGYASEWIKNPYGYYNIYGRPRKNTKADNSKTRKKVSYGLCPHCGKKGVYVEIREYVTEYDKKLKYPQYTHLKCKYCHSKFTIS